MLTVEELRKRWQGVVIPLVTPFKASGEVDLAALAANVQWIMDQGARMGNTVFLAAGSGGDFTSMSLEERKMVIGTVCEVAAGKIPVIAGSQSNDIRDCIAIAQFCEKAGVDAIQLSGAYYYDGRPGDAIGWMKEVARHTSIGFAVYNNWYTGYDMPLDVIDEILNIPNSIAVKWGSPNVRTFMDGIRRFNERVVVVDNSLLPEVAYMMGVKNHISHLPNFYPQHSWKVHELFMAGKYQEGKREWDRCIVPWRKLIAPIQAQTGGEGVFVRPGMAAAGLNGGVSRFPSRDEVVTPELRRQYAEFLELCKAGGS